MLVKLFHTRSCFSYHVYVEFYVSLFNSFTFFVTSFSFEGLIIDLIFISHDDKSLFLKLQKQPTEVFCKKLCS